jgi:Flp pilus assembly protein TadD
VKLYFDWDWPGAEAEFQRAIALDPNQPGAHQWYSIYLLAAGRPREALLAIEAAQQRDPLSLAVNTDLGFHFYYTGRYDEAVKRPRHEPQLPARASLARQNLPGARQVR